MHLGQMLFIAGEEICISNGIDEEELVEVWMAFSVSHLGGAAPTVDTLVQMERKELGKKQEVQPQPHLQSRSLESTLIIYSGKEPAYPLYTVLIVFVQLVTAELEFGDSVILYVEHGNFIVFLRLGGLQVYQYVGVDTSGINIVYS
jgi:hypothetical protein